MSFRDKVAALLADRKYDDVLALVRKERRAIRTVVGLLYHDDLVSWRAVTMMGRLAAAEPEIVRPFISRLFWSLSEESSVVGWGSAQALGEIARTAPELTRHTIRAVLHYLDDEELSAPANRNTVMLCGSIWAIGQLADAEPELTAEMGPPLTVFLDDPDPRVRGLVAWALGETRQSGAAEKIAGMVEDEGRAQVYIGEDLAPGTVGEFAARALERMKRK